MAFIKGLGDPLRSAKACITEAETYNVLFFDTGSNSYGFKMGNEFAPIQILPKGVNNKDWFAQWLTQNRETEKEINSRTDLAKQMSKTAD